MTEVATAAPRRVRPGTGRALLSTLVLVAALGTALGAFSALVTTSGPWLAHLGLALIGTAAVVAGTRALTASVWLPSIAGLAVAGYGLLAGYGGGPLPLVPDGGSTDRVWALAQDGIAAIRDGVVPLDVPRSVELLIVGAVLLLYLAADLLALGVQMPALAGLALATLWVPAAALGFPGSTWALVGTGLLYLVLILLGRDGPPAPRPRAGPGRSATTGMIAAAVVVVLAVIGVPALTALPIWSWSGPPVAGTGSLGSVRLADDLDLRDSLGPQSEQVVLRYQVAAVGQTDDGAPRATATLAGPLRSFTLRDFDGRSWSRDTGGDLTDWDRDTLLASDPALVGTAPDPARGTLVRLDLVVGALREERLPVTVFPRTVDIGDPWTYDAARDEVVGGRTDVSQRYDMVVEVPELTADLLRSSVGEYPEDVQPYLDVPGTDHEDELRDLAAELTADAATPFDQALALQTYFRDTTRFRYDTSVAEGETEDAVWDFLQSRRGYCVQYATSMTVLARMLGIPARLGVGFLPGSLADDGDYEITGSDAHAWPELYFPGVGWVRFEPTPAVQTGAPPSWSNPSTASAPAASTAPTAAAPSAAASASAAAAASASASAAAQAAGARQSTGRIEAGLITVLALLLVSGIIGGVLLSRRRPAPTLTAERAWARLRSGLRKLGVTWADSRTPRQAAEAIRTQVDQARGRPLGSDASHALAALLRAVEAERYTVAPEPVAPDELRGWVDQVLADIRGTRGRHDGPAAQRPVDVPGTPHP